MSTELYGTSPHYLVRTDDPDTSHIAAGMVDTTRLEKLVYQAIKTFGLMGCISDQARAMFPLLSYSSVTARYRALLDKGLIVDTGARRRGTSSRPQRVMVASCHLPRPGTNE